MNGRLNKGWTRVSLVALALPAALLVSATPAQAAEPAAGAFAEAYGLMSDLTALAGNVPVKIAPRALATSSCPVIGGTKTANELSVGDANAVKADLLNDSATADCGAKSAKATAQLVNVDALGAVPQAKIHIDAITATTTTTCASAPKGSTTIANLSIGGNVVPIPDIIPPNTVIADPLLSVLGLKIILNEQHPASLGRGMVVNGLHLIAAGTGAIPVGGTLLRGDLVIAHAVSGVVCPAGPGTDNGGLPKPDISFYKGASPSVAKAGDTVTYTAIVTNQSAAPCQVLKLIDHIAPAFTLVSTAGPFGTALESPAPSTPDGGVNAVLRPAALTIAAGKSATQTFTVKVKDGATPGTYYDTLEIFCGVNGNFVSGPLAPVTIPGEGVPAVPPLNPVVAPPGAVETPDLAATGGAPALAVMALVALVAGVGVRRLRTSA